MKTLQDDAWISPSMHRPVKLTSFYSHVIEARMYFTYMVRATLAVALLGAYAEWATTRVASPLYI